MDSKRRCPTIYCLLSTMIIIPINPAFVTRNCVILLLRSDLFLNLPHLFTNFDSFRFQLGRWFVRHPDCIKESEIHFPQSPQNRRSWTEKPLGAFTTWSMWISLSVTKHWSRKSSREPLLDLSSSSTDFLPLAAHVSTIRGQRTSLPFMT
jgi:hypothetical protein